MPTMAHISARWNGLRNGQRVLRPGHQHRREREQTRIAPVARLVVGNGREGRRVLARDRRLDDLPRRNAAAAEIEREPLTRADHLQTFLPSSAAPTPATADTFMTTKVKAT